jgi:hypothetical protein
MPTIARKRAAAAAEPQMVLAMAAAHSTQRGRSRMGHSEAVEEAAAGLVLEAAQRTVQIHNWRSFVRLAIANSAGSYWSS